MKKKDVVPAIKIEGLTKQYKNGWRKKVTVLDNLTLDIIKGEIFGFLGTNGAGKTTTMKLLAGLIFPTKGRSLILDKQITDPTLRKMIGFLPENPRFHPHLTGEELLGLYAGLSRLRRGEVKERINYLLKLVDLEGARKLRLHKFSRGMTQRIGIAQMLLSDPQVLILDEPMAGLDPVGRRLISSIILKLREEGKTTFFSSHLLTDAESICDRVGIMVKGRLKRAGKLCEFIDPSIDGKKGSLEDMFLQETGG